MEDAHATSTEAGSRTSRKRFLRQLGLTLAAAVGAAALPAAAHATVNCCPDNFNQCPGSTCGPDQQVFFCSCRPVGLEDYCTCEPTGTNCYNGPC